MKIYKYFIGLLFVVGCKKFFDIKPSSTNLNPTTISDYKEILNTDSNALCDYLLLDLSSDADSLGSGPLTALNSSLVNAYLWKKKIWADGEDDAMYNTAYSRILQMNVVLESIDGAIKDANSSEDDRSIVRSQALINRAFYYWQLANIYGPAYQEPTASQDLAVPIITKANANNLPSRSTTKAVYNFIISDLKSAISNPKLPEMGEDIIHPGKASGYAMLARTYLYMNNYDSALIYSDSALQFKSTLTDYSNYIMPTQLISLKSNPEIYLGRFCINSSMYPTLVSSFYISYDLTNVFSSSADQRLNLFFLRDRFYIYSTYIVNNENQLCFDYSISVPEMLLTKAECLVRNGNYDEAISLVNQIREKRILSYAYSPITDYSPANTDSIVLAERRKELSFHGGLRWFDLKRLNKESKFAKTLIRNSVDTLYNTINVGTLKPNSPNYIIPFSDVIINNNPNMIQNIRE